MKSLKLKYVVLLIAAIIIADQAIKIWIKTTYEVGQETHVLGFSWFRLHFIENSGMAWGLKFWAETGKVILTLFRLGAVIFGVWYLRKIVREKYSRGFIICAALIFAGALGNLIDSMFYGMIFDKGLVFNAAIQDYLPPYEGLAHFSSKGYGSFLHGSVVDMFYFPIIEDGTFPSWLPIIGGEKFTFFSAIFNLADASISVGVILLLIFQKRFYKKQVVEKSKQGAETNVEVSDNTQIL